MKYTEKELAEMADKLRTGETIEIEGVRIKAHRIKSKSVIACGKCKVKCELIKNLATICSLTDVNDPVSFWTSQYHYLEYVDSKEKNHGKDKKKSK